MDPHILSYNQRVSLVVDLANLEMSVAGMHGAKAENITFWSSFAQAMRVGGVEGTHECVVVFNVYSVCIFLSLLLSLFCLWSKNKNKIKKLNHKKAVRLISLVANRLNSLLKAFPFFSFSALRLCSFSSFLPFIFPLLASSSLFSFLPSLPTFSCFKSSF